MALFCSTFILINFFSFSLVSAENASKTQETLVHDNARPTSSVCPFERNKCQMKSPAAFSLNDQTLDELENFSNFDDTFTLRSTPVSYYSGFAKPKQVHGRLSARCYPFIKEHIPPKPKYESDQSDSEYYMSCGIDDTGDSVMEQTRNVRSYTALPVSRDFIRRLPVHISKSILGFLDAQSLTNCVCVSSHWRILAEEVKNEMRVQHITKDDIMLIQVLKFLV